MAGAFAPQQPGAQRVERPDPQRRATSSPRSPATRSRISPAALLVKVTARIGLRREPAAIRWAMRWVMTRVFPEPAPARTSSGPSVLDGLALVRVEAVECVHQARCRARAGACAGPRSLDRDALGEVARLVDVAAAADGDVVREQLQRDRRSRIGASSGCAVGHDDRRRRRGRSDRRRRRPRSRRAMTDAAARLRPPAMLPSIFSYTASCGRDARRPACVSSMSAIGPCFISPAA